MRYLLLVIGLIIIQNITAQNYTRDAGVRVGDRFTIAGRQFTDEDKALEVMMSIGRKGMTVTLLREYFQPVFGHLSENLHFIYGFGTHLGFRYTDEYRLLTHTIEFDEKRFTPLLGINGIIGIEYRFPEFPFLISFDIKPYFEYSTLPIFNVYLNSLGLSLKYRF